MSRTILFSLMLLSVFGLFAPAHATTVFSDTGEVRLEAEGVCTKAPCGERQTDEWRRAGLCDDGMLCSSCARRGTRIQTSPSIRVLNSDGRIHVNVACVDDVRSPQRCADTYDCLPCQSGDISVEIDGDRIYSRQQLTQKVICSTGGLYGGTKSITTLPDEGHIQTIDFD